MAWENAIVTNVGVEMLKEVLEGSVMTLDYASGGTGTVSAASLMNQTEVSDERAQYEIVGFSSVTGGKRINILLTNEGLNTGYQMKQLGIWAHVGDGSPALLAILQDNSGVAIPSEAEIDQFSLNFYAVIAFSWSEGSLVLNTDPSTYVSQQQLTDGLAGKIDKVSGATAGNVPIFLAGGGVADSGKPLTPAGIGAAARSDMTAAQQAIANLNSNIGNIRYAQYAVSGGSSRSITLATWAVYLVSTFLGFHVVFTGSSSYTPVIETVRGNSSLPVTSEASATIVLGNTTGSTYQFSVIRIL